MHNLANVRKDEIVKRSNFRCKHRHSGLEHWQCYDEAHNIKERIGHFDIETFSFGFDADAGVVLTYCIKEHGGAVIKNFVTKAELLSDTPDKRLIADLCNDLRKFDLITTFYGKRFDVPYVRTRALFYGLDFPGYKVLDHIDVYDIVKHRLKFRSNSLGRVCKFFGIPAKGHQFGFNFWRKAFQGDSKAMAGILAHNQEDVESLEALWILVTNQFRVIKSSI